MYVLLTAIVLIASFNGYRTTVAFTAVPSNQALSPFSGRVNRIGRPVPEFAAIMNESVDETEATLPFAIIVQTEIVPERLDEFVKLIETNAVSSRKEPECLRFDVVQSQEQSNLFFFYEVYKNGSSAIDHHKAQSHYQLWADFKASGGTLSSITYKANGKFLT